MGCFMTQFDKDLQSDNRELFLQIREYILSFEGVREVKKQRITTFLNSLGGICHLRTMPHGVDIGFLKGAKMTDQRGRLAGSGKAIRVLSLSSFEPETIRDYLRQGLQLNG